MNDMDSEADKLEIAVRLAKALLEVSFHVRTLAWRRGEDVSDESDRPTGQIPLRNVARLLTAVGKAEAQLDKSSKLLPPFIADVVQRVLSDVGEYFAVLGTAILFPSTPDSPQLVAAADERTSGFTEMTSFIDGLALTVAVSGVDGSIESPVHALLEGHLEEVRSLTEGLMLQQYERLETELPGYLGIRLTLHLKATRQGCDSIAKFGRNFGAWNLFVCLCKAGQNGRSFRDLMRDLDMETKSETALRQHKDKANGIIEDLRLEIEAKGTGTWRIVSLKSV